VEWERGAQLCICHEQQHVRYSHVQQWQTASLYCSVAESGQHFSAMKAVNASFQLYVIEFTMCALFTQQMNILAFGIMHLPAQLLYSEHGGAA
jgi:hypothetical protein